MFYESLNCPYCGGTLPPPLGTRKIKCLYCDKSLYFRSKNYIPRFVLEENKNLDLKRDTEKLFASKVVNPLVQKEAILVSRKRMFIPFYLLTGKRGGVMETGKERIVSHCSMKINLDPQNNVSTGYLRNKPEIIVEEDTRVVLSDFRYIYEASTLEEAGLSQESLRKSILTNISQLKATDTSELYRIGEVVSPNIPKEIIIQNGIKSAKGGKDSLEILEMHLALVYYPIEELLFSFRGTYFKVAYDLIRGDFVWGLLPCRRNLTVFAALVLSSFLGFFFGQFISFLTVPFALKEIQKDFSSWMFIGTFVFFFASLVFGGGLNIAYLLLKTPFVAKVTPEGLSIGKMADPPKSFLSPYLKFVIKTLENGFDEALKGKRQ